MRNKGKKPHAGKKYLLDSLLEAKIGETSFRSHNSSIRKILP